MFSEFKIAFIPTDSRSHITTFAILAKTMRDLGHKCVFVVHKDTESLLTADGFECRCYQSVKYGFEDQSDVVLQMSPLAMIRPIIVPMISSALNKSKLSYNELKPIIADLKPDAIVVDRLIYSPAVVCAGVPWVTVITANPLRSYSDESLPPSMSGYGINSDKTLWDEFNKERDDGIEGHWLEFNRWLESLNAPQLKHRGKYYNESPYLNLYNYPKELDYYENGPKGKNWRSFDSMIGYNVDNESKGFEIPEKLRERSGKLVLLSMGTVFNNLHLMKRFVSMLSNSKHRFIVTKGRFGDEYELADNMWGQNWLPQLQVLPVVDLVLTHGGNNTFTECLYFGKPMIVFPIIADQYDNAQRLVDKELGARLDPYECTQLEVFEAMDRLLNDSQLKAKYENISQRMKSSKSRQMSAKLIEDLIRDEKMKKLIIN